VTRHDRVALAGVVFAVLFAQVLLYPGIPDLVETLGGTPAGWEGEAGAVLDAGKWFLAAEFLEFVLFAGLWGATRPVGGRRWSQAGPSPARRATLRWSPSPQPASRTPPSSDSGSHRGQQQSVRSRWPSRR